MKKIILLATLLASNSILAGPLVGGGGGAKFSPDRNGIVIDIGNIVDIRTINNTVINVDDIWSAYNQNHINGHKPADDLKKVWVDLSEKSDVIDVQLKDGTLIDKWSLRDYYQATPSTSNSYDENYEVHDINSQEHKELVNKFIKELDLTAKHLSPGGFGGS